MPTHNLRLPAGSAWATRFGFQTANGTPTGTPEDLTDRTWEFDVRPDAADTSATPTIAVTTTTGDHGIITVDLFAGTVTVSLTAAAVQLLGTRTWAYALWMDPGDTATRTARVDGALVCAAVAQPGR